MVFIKEIFIIYLKQICKISSSAIINIIIKTFMKLSCFMRAFIVLFCVILKIR